MIYQPILEKGRSTVEEQRPVEGLAKTESVPSIEDYTAVKGIPPVEDITALEGVAPIINVTAVESASPPGDSKASTSLPTEEAALVLTARNDGYSPEILHAKAGEPTTLQVVTNQTRSCSRAFVIPELGVEELLPETGSLAIEIPPQEAGKQLWFTCSMGMYTGEIIFDQ